MLSLTCKLILWLLHAVIVYIGAVVITVIPIVGWWFIKDVCYCVKTGDKLLSKMNSRMKKLFSNGDEHNGK